MTMAERLTEWPADEHWVHLRLTQRQASLVVNALLEVGAEAEAEYVSEHLNRAKARDALAAIDRAEPSSPAQNRWQVMASKRDPARWQKLASQRNPNWRREL
jgi:hypothetical protein